MKECILQNWTDSGASQDYIPFIVPLVGSASAYISINDCHPNERREQEVQERQTERCGEKQGTF